MSDGQVRVTFQPHGRAVFVLKGTKILEAASRCGLTIETPCGGLGTCGKCRVRLSRGACEPTAAERETLPAELLDAGWRLACQATVCQETVIDVPDSSLFAGRPQIVTDADTDDAEVLPAVRKVHVTLAEPSLEDDTPDLLRLQEATGAVKVDLDLLRGLGGRLRASGFAGTAVLSDHHLLDFEPGDTTSECCGVAFDVGTTTVVGSLIDLCTGREIAVETSMNPQVRFGDDVLSRIQHGSTPAGLEELRSAVAEAIDAMIGQLCEQAGLGRDRVYEITLSGNTTMQHLLCGIDPSQLGQVPFVPAFGRSLVIRGVHLGLSAHPGAAAVVFPVIGGFVGGDTVAGILSTRLTELGGPALMVDIGTNGEIVLASDGRLWAASTAAGPAFEGARISCGMRATDGAIEKVVFDDDVRASVIGGTEPIGLCGSALVDATAELLRSGIVTPAGRMLAGDDLPDELSEAIRRRVIVADDDQPAFVLADGNGNAPAVRVTQKDIRELQLATGAMRAGMVLLLRRAGLDVDDLQHVLIAGGFGSFIRRSNAQRIGLLPGGIDHRKILYVGNTSLSGAKWALASTRARLRADDLARKAQHVELSRDANFQMEFAEAMIFPAK